MNATVSKLITKFNLAELPEEGVLVKNTYHSRWLTEGSQAASSAMIGLLSNDPLSVSRFHRLACDEIWHFYVGDPIHLFLIRADGHMQEVVLGKNPLDGHEVQFLVPAGTWQAAHISSTHKYALFGCTTTPAFQMDLFEAGFQDDLTSAYPRHSHIIAELGCQAP